MKRDLIRTPKDLKEIFPDVPVFVVPHLHECQLPKKPVEAEIEARKAKLRVISQSRNNKKGE